MKKMPVFMVFSLMMLGLILYNKVKHKLKKTADATNIYGRGTILAPK